MHTRTIQPLGLVAVPVAPQLGPPPGAFGAPTLPLPDVPPQKSVLDHYKEIKGLLDAIGKIGDPKADGRTPPIIIDENPWPPRMHSAFNFPTGGPVMPATAIENPGAFWPSALHWYGG